MARLLSIVWDILYSLFPDPETPPQDLPMNEKTNADIILDLCEKYYRQELSPLDPVDDNLACVDSLTNLLRMVYPDFPKEYHTAALLRQLKNSKHFTPSLDLSPGNVIINATGTGNGLIRGHCGIIGRDGRIFSNDSTTGLWMTHYTLDSWKTRYRIKGGMPTYVFQPL